MRTWFSLHASFYYLDGEGEHRYFTSFVRNLVGLASFSNRIHSKFMRSFKFVVVNANAKCVATVGFLESVNKAFAHLDFPLILSQNSISVRFITPRVLNSLPFIRDSLASLSQLQLTNITFASFVSAELNSKLSIMNRHLYLWYLDKQMVIPLSLTLISTGFNLLYLSKFCSPPILQDQ